MEEDTDLLALDAAQEDPEKKLSFNNSNAVLMRHGEKTILRFLMDAADQIIPLFDMDFKSARKASQALPEIEKYRDYITGSVLQLIKQKTG